MKRSIRKKIVQITFVVCMAVVLIGQALKKENVPQIYRNYSIYDGYKEDGKNLAKQAVAYMVYDHSCDYIGYTYAEYSEWSSEFIDYLKEALENQNVENAMKSIVCNYEILSLDQKEAIMEKQSEFHRYYETDIWYRLHMRMSAESNDYVIYHQTMEGYKQYFMILDDSDDYTTADIPMYAGGQKRSEPYFIQWNDKNYVVFSYWDRENKKIVGLVVYDGYGDLVSIGMNQDGTFQVVPQDRMFAHEGNERWWDYYNTTIPIMEVY